MKQILLAALAYLAVTLALGLALAPGGQAESAATVARTLAMTGQFLGQWTGFGLALIGVAVALERRRLIERAGPILMMFAASLCLHVGFVFLKGTIPALMPYWADPALADLERGILGTDAWRIAHALVPQLPGWMPDFYLGIWALAAVGFPIALAALDRDAQRAQRYLWLFFGAWVVVGWAMAVLGASVGPVFYDRLEGGSRFADLTAALAASGIAGSKIGAVQADLWAAWENGRQSFSPAMSAFPSMHVAVATVTALYLAERSRLLGLLGAAFWAVVMFLSVYTGYHYALDGIAATAAVLALRAAIGALQSRDLPSRNPAIYARMLRAIAASQLLRSVR
ncbi:MAG: phosphatase PAP2 family protein [Paenirhodobacter sp.]|uniref:phosphatase PAP2 family protein n=1 Tax=Paenirhodobacter sp. TaxID=1965326 RepID=UPI003D0E0C07